MALMEFAIVIQQAWTAMLETIRLQGILKA
jgi:hypothetical protein